MQCRFCAVSLILHLLQLCPQLLVFGLESGDNVCGVNTVSSASNTSRFHASSSPSGGRAFGYTRLLEESNGVLQDLKQVINVSTLSMTDKDRMDVVDNCYYEMRRYRNLVSYYTNKNIAVSYLRARKKNDLERVMRLYGNETSKYW